MGYTSINLCLIASTIELSAEMDNQQAGQKRASARRLFFVQDFLHRQVHIIGP